MCHFVCNKCSSNDFWLKFSIVVTHFCASLNWLDEFKQCNFDFMHRTSMNIGLFSQLFSALHDSIEPNIVWNVQWAQCSTKNGMNEKAGTEGHREIASDWVRVRKGKNTVCVCSYCFFIDLCVYSFPAIYFDTYQNKMIF